MNIGRKRAAVACLLIGGACEAQRVDFEAISGYMPGLLDGQPFGQPQFWTCFAAPGWTVEVYPGGSPFPTAGDFVARGALGARCMIPRDPCPGAFGVTLEFHASVAGPIGPSGVLGKVEFAAGSQVVKAEFSAVGGGKYGVVWTAPSSAIIASCNNLSPDVYYVHRLCLSNTVPSGSVSGLAEVECYDSSGNSSAPATCPPTSSNVAVSFGSSSAIAVTIDQTSDSQLSVDNVGTVCKVIECYPDCNGSGLLDFFDFLCYQNAFVDMLEYADCDASGGLDVFDFLCFQNEFNNGCP